METFKLELKSSKMLNEHVRHMVFQRADKTPIDFIPGQFITFHLPTPEKLMRRSYSIASMAHHTQDIEIAVSYVVDGFATKILSALQPGDSLTAAGPFGRLILRESEVPERLIMVATGTGITPFRAMLSEFNKRSDNTRIVVIEGVRRRSELLYAEDFTHFASEYPNVSFYACYSREYPDNPEPHELHGRVQVALEKLHLKPEQDIVYLCGNPDMIDDCFADLKETGFAPTDVRREKYISS